MNKLLNKRYVVLIAICTILVVVPFTYILGWFLYNQFFEGNIVNNSKKFNKCYLEHKNNVYYYDYHEFYYLKKISSDPKGFQVFSKDLCIGKDKKSVYFRDRLFKDADPSTYEIVYTGYFTYSKDDNSVFYQDRLIENADAATFIVRQDRSRYAQDDNQVFYEGELMPGAKPQSLILLYDERYEPAEEYSMDTSIKKVYFNEVEIGADGNSFKVINSYLRISKDKDNVFYKDKVIPGFDPGSLVIVDDQRIIKDKNHVLFILNGYKYIENVDASKFQKYNSGICGDGVNFFYCNTGGKK